MKIKLVIVNGKPRVGKDTFMDFSREALIKRGDEVRKFSLIDPIRNFASIDDKDDAYRLALHLMKKALDDVPQYSLVTLAINHINQIKELEENEGEGNLYIFLCVRERKDIERIKTEMEINGIRVMTVLVKGNKTMESIQYGNEADDNTFDQKDYDWTIYNNETLEGFQDKVENFWNFENYTKK